MLYASRNNRCASELMTLLTDESASIEVESYSRFDNLIASISSPQKEENVIVFFADETVDIERIIINRGLFWNIRLVLVIDGNDNIAISLAHRLRPRFIGYNDMPAVMLATVLEKMRKRLINESETPY